MQNGIDIIRAVSLTKEKTCNVRPLFLTESRLFVSEIYVRPRIPFKVDYLGRLRRPDGSSEFFSLSAYVSPFHLILARGTMNVKSENRWILQHDHSATAQQRMNKRTKKFLPFKISPVALELTRIMRQIILRSFRAESTFIICNRCSNSKWLNNTLTHCTTARRVFHGQDRKYSNVNFIVVENFVHFTRGMRLFVVIQFKTWNTFYTERLTKCSTFYYRKRESTW